MNELLTYFRTALDALSAAGNLRTIPAGEPCRLDFSTNDYLGLAQRTDLLNDFISHQEKEAVRFTSSASRLLASDQKEYGALETQLESLYGRPCLLFNSGYHANTGLISAFADTHTLIAADKLVHASILDGVKLSGATLRRWRHNDYEHLQRILADEEARYNRVLIVAESVYSMDGDRADLRRLAEIKRSVPGAMLYVDEAHAFGVEGPRGLGLTMDLPEELAAEIDVIVGTFGKACASMGAFAAMNSTLRDYAVNRARSFIFSTSLPPVNQAWTRYMIRTFTEMDSERQHLRRLGEMLHTGLKELGVKTGKCASHIQPVVVGDAHRVVEISGRLLEQGIKVLPIRTPTVPPGTERLRISLSAANTKEDVGALLTALRCAL